MKRVTQDRMRSLEISGYGRCGLLDEGHGTAELYMIELEGVGLGLYKSGLAVRESGQENFYRFDEILEVISCLSAEIFSRASADQSRDFSLPLIIRMLSGEIVLSIPFLAYSRFLNVLVDLKKED